MTRIRYKVTRRGKTVEIRGAAAQGVRGYSAKRRLGLTGIHGHPFIGGSSRLDPRAFWWSPKVHPRGKNGRFVKK